MITRLDIIEEAMKYENVPFRHAGRNENGLDCVGLLIKIMHSLGITEWDDVNYNRIVNSQRMRSEIELFCTSIPAEEMDLGDVLLFSVLKHPQHVGIIVNYDQGHWWFLHAYESVNKVVIQRLDNKWFNRIDTVFRYKELEG